MLSLLVLLWYTEVTLEVSYFLPEGFPPSRTPRTLPYVTMCRHPLPGSQIVFKGFVFNAL